MTSKLIHPKRGDIYWANLDPVKGSEQGKPRPVFILSNNLANTFSPVVSIVPMTRNKNETKQRPTLVPFEQAGLDIAESAIEKLKEKGFQYAPVGGFFLCNQTRTIAKSRLIEKLGRVTDTTYIKLIEKSLNDVYGFSSCWSCEFPINPSTTICPNRDCNAKVQKKCTECRTLASLDFNYCPNCGGDLK